MQVFHLSSFDTNAIVNNAARSFLYVPNQYIKVGDKVVLTGNCLTAPHPYSVNLTVYIISVRLYSFQQPTGYKYLVDFMLIEQTKIPK